MQIFEYLIHCPALYWWYAVCVFTCTTIRWKLLKKNQLSRKCIRLCYSCDLKAINRYVHETYAHLIRRYNIQMFTCRVKSKQRSMRTNCVKQWWTRTVVHYLKCCQIIKHNQCRIVHVNTFDLNINISQYRLIYYFIQFLALHSISK